MRKILSLILVLSPALSLVLAQEPPPLPRTPNPKETSCYECHSQLDDAALEPTQHMDTDVHLTNGMVCSDCHGGNPQAGFDGDPSAAHDESMGFIGKPRRLDIPRLCAKCHSDATFMKKYDPSIRVDQLSEYVTSVHGQRNAAGDDRTAVCSDCHHAHGILKVDDPRSPVYPVNLADTCSGCHSQAELMRGYGLAADQVSNYKKSVHASALYDAGDLSAPTCNDCHGSHGAAPPGVGTVANVCGSCHTRESTLFKEMEVKKDLDLAACIQCVICHSNHAVLKPTSDMLGVGPKSTCTGCHNEGEPGYAAAAEMAELRQRLSDQMHEAEERLDAAERAGVEVGPDRFTLSKARDSLVETRVLVHSFDIERFVKVADEGLEATQAGLDAGDRAFAELRFRRVGLGASLVVILAVIISLTLMVRRIER